MSDFRIDITSAAFRGRPEAERILLDSRALCEGCGVEFGVQLHNTCDFEQIRYFVDRHVPLSAHAPVEQMLNWNMAASDMSDIWKAVDENVDYLRSLNVKAAVFHGFFMTDLPVPAFGHGRSIFECMSEVFRPELARWPDMFTNRDFTGTPEYLERRERVRLRLRMLRERHPDLTICIENDYPGFGEGSMLPKDLVYYQHPLCLDTGHLWLTSHLFGLDFLEAAKEMIASGNVKMMHLHASKYDDSYPDREWSDGHLPLSIPNAKAMRLGELVTCAVAAGLRHIVLEIPAATENDVRILLGYLGRL